MDLKDKKIGIALTGSFCTYEKVFIELQKLTDARAEVYPILSDASRTITSRFGSPEQYIEKIRELTGKDPITCIEGAEPSSPAKLKSWQRLIPEN